MGGKLLVVTRCSACPFFEDSPLKTLGGILAQALMTDSRTTARSGATTGRSPSREATRQRDVLGALAADGGWIRPMNIGARDGSHHSATLGQLARHEHSSECSASDRKLPDDPARAPAWCPARGGVTVKLDELPGDFHRWTERGAAALKPQLCKGEISSCRRCALRRKSVQRWFKNGTDRRSVWTWAYEVNGEWVFDRPECGTRSAT